MTAMLPAERQEMKARVRAHWEREVCGTRFAQGDDRRAYFAELERYRYEQDYMLRDFAQFPSGRGKRVIEVGVGAGSDFLNWVRSGAEACGYDITQAAVDLVHERLGLEGLAADVSVGDAEALPAPSGAFDIFYSWGVLHHTPDTEKAIAEAYRVLKPGCVLKIMLYHFPSVASLLVWTVHGPLARDFRSIRAVCADHIESPNTNLFTTAEARAMVGRYFQPSTVSIRTFLGSGDLLSNTALSEQYGDKWKIAMRLYPRWFVRRLLGHSFGTVMTIEAVK